MDIAEETTRISRDGIMTEYTQEELDKIVAEKVAFAQKMTFIRENGNGACTMSMEYLQDQYKRGIIPVGFVQVFEMIHQTFLKDMNAAQPAPPQDQPKES